jgi:hypothetical protein
MPVRILLFGPNEWGPGRVHTEPDPWTHRQNLAAIFQRASHTAELFEDLPDHPDGLAEKFEREVGQGEWDFILIYLPTGADTGSINSEMTLLRQQLPKVARAPRILLWCQDRILEENDKGLLQFRDPPMKSAYLLDFTSKVRTTVVNWDIHEELYARIEQLAKDLN